MDHYNKYKQALAINTFLAIFVPGVLGTTTYILVNQVLAQTMLISLLAAGAIYLISGAMTYVGLLDTSTKPLRMVWQAILHVSPDKSAAPPPKLDDIKIGRELVSSIVMQIYDMASSNPGLLNPSMDAQPNSKSDPSLLESVPLALFVLDKDWNITQANKLAAQYLELERSKLLGKNVHDVLHMSFTNEDTLDSWLEESVEKRATDSHTWEQVKINVGDKNKSKQFDLAASYSKDNVAGNEAILAIFDRDSVYSVQDNATSYVALAVHELRTPLTMLRGYIELFEEEIGEDLSEEHKEFMNKMSVSAQMLTAFVNNILNVARVDENQFVLKLREDDWSKVLTEITDSLRLRAEVKDKQIKLDIQPNLPSVGIDRISMFEVVGNLVDNAIKYSGQSKEISIKARLGDDGSVETTVEDHGDGMPESVVGELFSKFYRSHRSKNAVSGSGLGLYLVKSIIDAHGGRVWAKSKEGQGSTFGFSLQAYADIDDQDKSKDHDGIERQASGWIKNHSLYRR